MIRREWDCFIWKMTINGKPSPSLNFNSLAVSSLTES